jgi:hypothetical protein
MKPHRLIDGATFGPATVKAVGLAFDEAWVQIGNHFGNTPLEIESARIRLADAMLSIATEGSTDVAALKAAALRVMALNIDRAYGRRASLPDSQMTPH